MRFQRLAQAPDVHVHGALLDVHVAAPHVDRAAARALYTRSAWVMKKCSRRYSVGPIVHRRVAREDAVRRAIDAQAAQG
jgi:hypothetical protein